MFDRNKFKQLVHYICHRRTDKPSTLGATKLNKILWLSDFMAYRELGEAITGARYVKREHGPVPHQILPILNELEKDGAIKLKHDYYHGYNKMSYLALKPIYPDFLSPKQRDIVNAAIDFVCDQHTATSISAFSHDDVWKLAQDGEEMPYVTVFAKPGQITDEDLDWAQLQLEQAG